jgi:hypothetical protein
VGVRARRMRASHRCVGRVRLPPMDLSRNDRARRVMHSGTTELGSAADTSRRVRSSCRFGLSRN